MTTSEPRTPHDDTPREHRRLGQRILDAVLGDPADTRPDATLPTPAVDDPDRAEGRTGAEGFAGDGPRGGYSSYEQAMRDPAAAGPSRTTAPLRARDTDAGDPDRRSRDVEPGRARRPGRRRPRRRARRTPGRGPGRLRRPERRRPRRRRHRIRRPARGRPGGHHRGPAGTGLRPARFPRRDGTGRGARPSPSGRRHRRRRPRPGHVQLRPGPGHRLRPARRRHGDGQRRRGGCRRPTGRGGTDYDAAGDTGYVDDPRRGGARDYDPAQDTGYVDASRAEADRTTGRRDDDFDTGRVDTGRADLGRADLDLDRDAGDRVPTEPVDRDRDDTHRGVGAAAGAAGAGAVAASRVPGRPQRHRP